MERQVKRTIRELREARGESQNQLADALGVSLKTLAEWERGAVEPSVGYLRALCAHFGVPDRDVKLRPDDPPSLAERVAGLL